MSKAVKVIDKATGGIIGGITGMTAAEEAEKARKAQEKRLAEEAKAREKQDKMVAEETAREQAKTTERRARLATPKGGLLYQGDTTGVTEDKKKTLG